MIILIGILIVILLIIVLYYNELIAAKVKIEDAQEALKNQLQLAFNLQENEIDGAIKDWQKNGLQLDAKSKLLFDQLFDAINKYNIKLKKFPFSVMSDILKMKSERLNF